MPHPFDIVTVADNVADPEIRGKKGYIIGEVTSEQCAVFIYAFERVWCLSPHEVMLTGETDVAARDYRGPRLRVNLKGEVLGWNADPDNE
jgi:hypothetical protein